MLAIFSLLYILFGAHLTLKSIIVVDALRQKGLCIDKVSLLLFAIVMPFILPMAYCTGIFKGMIIKLKSVKK